MNLGNFNRTLSAVLTLVFASLLLIGLTGCSDLFRGTASCASTFRETRTDSGDLSFTNLVDGYTVTMDPSFQVDMSLNEVCARFEAPSTRIEIYKNNFHPDRLRVAGEPPRSDETVHRDLVDYSNTFLENDTDHKNSSEETVTIGSRTVQVASWERDRLKRVPHDHNHYLTMDFMDRDQAYTISIESEQPLLLEDYKSLVESFTVTKPSRNAVAFQTEEPVVKERGWNPETEAFYRTYFLESDRLTWGLFEPQVEEYLSHPDSFLEDRLNYSFPIILWYNDLQDTSDPAYFKSVRTLLEDAYRCGKTVELTLQTTNTGENNSNAVYQVLNGERDAFLHSYAKMIAEFDHPVLFRPVNEMNGDWCVYSAYHTGKDANLYQEFYRYLYRIFEQEGADNVIWIWNPNKDSKPDMGWNHILNYYPGDEYVDVVGMTAYNTGTYYAQVGESWHTFSELYDDLYRNYTAHFAQPLMITEFSCANKGGNKVEWIQDMFRTIKEYPKIRVAVWWNYCDFDKDGTVARSYFLNESEEMLDAFREGLAEFPLP